MTGCEKYIQQMNRYLDGDLPASQISDLLEHLESCPSCRNRFDALKIIAFEMRHMQKQPPASLHEHIMGAVRRTPQKRSQSYLRAFGMLAACAALLVLTLQQGFFRTMGDYLFPQDGVYSGGTMADTTGQAAKGSTQDSLNQESNPETETDLQTPADAQDQAGDTGDVSQYGITAEANETGSSGLQMEGRSQTVPADSETNSSTPRTEEVPASLEPSESSQGASNVTNGPETDSTESSQGDVQPNTADLDSSSDASGKSTSNFMVPFLDTDEVFAFYCVATGKGEIPNAFEEDEIVRYPDKNCVYIYVSTQHFTQTGCENLLRLGGFTIHNPINLPKTDAGMPYGLVVIYQYQQR